MMRRLPELVGCLAGAGAVLFASVLVLRHLFRPRPLKSSRRAASSRPGAPTVTPARTARREFDPYDFARRLDRRLGHP